MAEIYIGLMTGTSADSLDVAAVDFSNDQIKVVGQENFSIPHELKEEIKIIDVNLNVDFDPPKDYLRKKKKEEEEKRKREEDEKKRENDELIRFREEEKNRYDDVKFPGRGFRLGSS